MNKIITGLFLMMGLIATVNAQVGIGTTSPDASAALDITSTDKGLLMPRMSTAQREAISSPATSLMVFDTDTNSYWSYLEGVWVEDKPGEGKFVEGGAADIAYYSGRVGIGRENFPVEHRLWVENAKNASESNTSAVVRGSFNGTGTAGVTIGLVGVARNNSTGTIPFAIGSQGVIENPNAGGTITTAVGSYPQISNSGNVTYGSGSIILNSNISGTMATGRGMDVSLSNASGASIGTGSLASMYAVNEGEITGDGYGLFIGGQPNTGTVAGNSYALYLSTPFSNVAGNAFALYSDNVNNSYMAGSIGFGTENPQQKVHIDGVIRLEPQAVAPTGGLGDLYVNTDGRIFFHNGTDWKEIQVVP